jgi:hypothetical protein
MRLTVIVTTMHLISTASYSQTPYAGMHARDIKALSEQQVADLANGRGMGLALAAELNGFPGPSHVLELAGKLELSPDQRAGVKALFDSTTAEALPLGSKLIDQERDLDSEFATRIITPETLTASTVSIAATHGALREAPLKYHLSTAAILTHDQIQHYAGLRGYGAHSVRHHHD